MRVLFVGDVHAKVEDLEDCDLLRAYIFGVVQTDHPDAVVFLGDQYDSHAVKNVQVERFWLIAFAQLKSLGVETYALVGNHDRPGSAAVRAHSMQVHCHDVHVIDQPYAEGPFLFLPYYHDPKKLVEDARLFPRTETLICHAAFAGGHYDNGQLIRADAFYGKDVVSPDDIPQRFIVSGHIHKGASFGKVWYPGSPRWQTMGDANVDRAIYLVDFDTNGTVTAREKAFPTGDVLRRTWHLVCTPEDLCESELAVVRPADKVLVDIRGPQAFCEERKRAFQNRHFRVRTFPTDRGVAKVSEAEGIPAAFEKHFAGYKPKYGTSPVILREMVRERLHV